MNDERVVGVVSAKGGETTLAAGLVGLEAGLR